MLAVLFAVLALQQAAGSIAWETPTAPSDPAEEAAAPMAAERAPAAPALPAWALADPFAWERAQCSPMIRKDASLESCQVRVRSDLAAALGDQLPDRLSPDKIEGCRQVSNGAGGYVVTCAPVERTLNAGPAAPAAEVCEERPVRNANGAVTFNRECRPATGQTGKDGLSFRLGRD